MTSSLPATLLMAFVITYFLIPPILKIAEKKQLFDIPDHRKKHQKPIPALGGISVFIGFWLSIFCFGELPFLAEIRYVLITSILILLIGIQDDLISIKPSTKFFWQFFIGAVLFMSGFQMQGMYGLFGIEELPVYINFIITVLTITLLINAFNLIDGVNGLAGSLGLIGAGGFGLLFWQIGAYNWTFLSLALIGGLLAFLKYNFGKADIFMGDNGSMFLGLIISIFFIKYINIAPADTSISPILIALSLIIIPVFDLIRVFGYRILMRQSPFAADRNHLHHILQGMGKSHSWVVWVTLVLNVSVILFVFNYFSQTSLALACTGIACFLLLFILAIRCSQSITEIKRMEIQRHQIGYWE